MVWVVVIIETRGRGNVRNLWTLGSHGAWRYLHGKGSGGKTGQRLGQAMIDLLFIVAYFAVMLFVGWRSRGQSAESYWVAERKYDTGRVTASLVATIFGASSTMGIIGLGYSRGLTGAWWSSVSYTHLRAHET